MKNLLKIYSGVCIILAAVFTAVAFILPSNVGEFYRYSSVLIFSIIFVDLMFLAHIGIVAFSLSSVKTTKKDDMLVPKLVFKNAIFLIILLLTCVILALYTAIPVWINPVASAIIVITNLIVILVTKGELKLFFSSVAEFFKKKIIKVVVIPCIIVVIASSVLLFSFIIPNARYNKALELMNSGDNSAACSIFTSISNYKDSAQKINEMASADAALTIYTAKIGDTIKFGKYEQDGDTKNGTEAIEWTVLDKKKNKILLLCNNCIEKIPYNDTLTETTWKDCTLRKWLNNDFYSSAFSDYEKSKIDATRLINHDNPAYNVPKGGKNTTDKVFILSLNEGMFYLKTDDLLHAKATTHVINQNASVGSDTDYGIWWLRTPGATNSSAATIHLQLRFSKMGYQVSHTLYSVRPAVWIEL